MQQDSQPRVLLVDDDEFLAKAARRLLRGRYQVDICPSCEAAHAIVDRYGEDFSAVLLDLGFGEGRLAGDDFLPTLKREYPDLEVVILTVVTDLARVKRCLQAGAFDFVEKTRMDVELPGALERAVRVVELRRERRAHEREAERLLSEERRVCVLAHSPSPEESAPLPTPSRLADLERRALTDALRLADGNLAGAARALGITKDACWRRAHRYGLVPDRKRPR